MQDKISKILQLLVSLIISGSSEALIIPSEVFHIY